LWRRQPGCLFALERIRIEELGKTVDENGMERKVAYIVRSQRDSTVVKREIRLAGILIFLGSCHVQCRWRSYARATSRFFFQDSNASPSNSFPLFILRFSSPADFERIPPFFTRLKKFSNSLGHFWYEPLLTLYPSSRTSL